MRPASDLRKLPRGARLLLAGGVVAAAFFLQWGLAAYAGHPPMLIVFALPIIACAYLGGIRTGLAATAAAGISSNYFLLPPVYSLAIYQPADQVQWGLLWLTGIVASLMTEELIRSCRKAQAGCERMEDLSRSAALFPEQNPHPVIRAARGGELLYANRAAAKLLEHWQCPAGARVPAAVEREIEVVLENGCPREVELHCDGRDLSFVLVPVTERGYVNFYGRDITAQKRVQEALRESERLYRAIGESIDYGVWVCAADGRNVYASESFLKMVGITQKQCSDFGWGDVLHPEDAERTIAAWKECVRTGGIWDIEHRFRGVDGQWHAVLARGVPVKNEKGEVLCWAGINLDIGRLKQTEQALRRTHEQLRMILESISDGFMSLDRHWRVIFVNEKGAQSAGQTRESMVGRVLWEIFPDAADSEFESVYHQAMIQRVTTTTEAYYAPLHAWFEARAYPSADGISVFFKDISERKQTEAKLKQSEEDLRHANERLEEKVRRRTQALEDTVATLRNEILVRKKTQTKLHRLSRKSLDALEADRRTVARELHDSIGGALAAIKFGLEEIAARARLDSAGGAPSIETLVSHLADTIKETKRISASLRPLTIDDLGLLATIDWYTRQFCQRYENIQIVCQIGVEEREIPEEFKIVFYRVMQEALTNAAKHSRADKVHIRLGKDASGFELEVEDNGCGFDPHHAFDGSDRLSGYGLKSMQERVEICGGILNLHSRPDMGTSVKISLPFAASSGS